MNLFKTPKEYLVSDKELFNLIFPIFIGFILDFLLGFVDSTMVSSVGEAAFSGVSLVDQFMSFVILFFSAFTSGGSIIIGQFLGNKQKEKAKNTCDQMLWFTTLLAVVLMIIFMCLRPFIIGALFGNIEADVWTNANNYYSIIMLSIPFLAVYHVGTAIFRVQDMASLPIKIILVSNVVNISCDTLFIYHLQWGAYGAAIATVMARLISAVLMLYFLINTKYKLHIKKTLKHKFDFNIIKSVLNVGLPSGVENGAFQFGKLLLTSLVSTFGTSAIAANSIGNTVGWFSVVPGLAINIALTIVISKCVGLNDYDQAKFYGKKCMLLVFISHLIVNILIFILLPYILGMYNVTPDTMEMASKMVIWHGIFSIIIWPLSFFL